MSTTSQYTIAAPTFAVYPSTPGYYCPDCGAGCPANGARTCATCLSIHRESRAAAVDVFTGLDGCEADMQESGAAHQYASCAETMIRQRWSSLQTRMEVAA